MVANNLTGCIELILQTPNRQHLELGEVLETVGGRSFGTLLLLPALVTLLPTGAIPGVPVVTSALISLVALQLLWGRETPWIPQRLAHISIERDPFARALRKSLPITRRVDKIIGPRLIFMTGTLGRRWVALLCLALAVSLIPLGAIPFAVAIPSGILVLLSLGWCAAPPYMDLAASRWSVRCKARLRRKGCSLSSKRNAADGRPAARPKGAPRKRHDRVAVLDKGQPLPAHCALS